MKTVHISTLKVHIRTWRVHYFLKGYSTNDRFEERKKERKKERKSDPDVLMNNILNS